MGIEKILVNIKEFLFTNISNLYIRLKSPFLENYAIPLDYIGKYTMSKCLT